MSFEWKFFNELGWTVFEPDNFMIDWASKAKQIAQQRLNLKEFDDGQLRCGGTWFVGTNFLENDSNGRLINLSFEGRAVKEIIKRYGKFFNEWDQAQVSICYQGYPKPDKSETPQAFSYRKNNYAAHVDGILPVGKTKRRHAWEYHAFIFGIPLVNYSKNQAPVVVWEGSHRIIRNFIFEKLSELPPALWKNQDITQIYHDARREAFLKCKRTIIVAPVGGSYLLHRLALHGIMPWEKGAEDAQAGRMIAYFRPLLSKPKFWLSSSI